MNNVLRVVIACCYVSSLYAMPVSIETESFEEDYSQMGGSIETLIAGFRRQQMFMSTTLLNTSLRLGVPQKLAAAQREEAEERRARAFRRKNEAMTPFIATSSQLNLGYIGRGYDIYNGNPLSDDGVVDQGFRLPVIDLPFSFRFSSDGEYRIPDNVDVISETSASFSSSYFQIKTESDYKTMLQVDAAINGYASGFGFDGSFSASTSYKSSKQEIQKGKTTTMNTVGRAVVYRARLSETAKVSKVSDYFESAIKSLPTDHCEDDHVQNLYIRVIEEFGTHFTTDVVMGAKAIQEVKFKNSDLDRLSSVGISASAAAKFSYSGLASGGLDVKVGFDSNTDQRKRIENTQKEEKEYYIGGKPPTGKSKRGSTETLREWARSAAENPAPIQYKLSSIDSLLRPNSFKDLSYGLYERRECLRKALFRYCSNMLSPNACSQQTDTRSRRKRSVDEINYNQKVKFGDFVKIRHSDKYLVLANNYGLISGSPIKPLTTATQIENYNGLFQLIPLEDENKKLGFEIHYGEPFQLQTIEGSQLFVGNVLMKNTDRPSRARIMDLLDDKDVKMTKDTQTDQYSDFSIFLKKGELCTYMISLYIRCYVSKPMSYMISIHGDGGSVSAKLFTSCACSGNFGFHCQTEWFHTFVVEEDIRNIQSVHLMEMYGYTTAAISKLKIMTMSNGRKTRIVDNDVNCKERECMVHVGDKAESKAININIYPIQFAFHSKDAYMTEGKPVHNQDLGYIRVLSSMKKQAFWGQPSTQMLECGRHGKVSIKDQRPSQHESVSPVCDGLIYPNNGDLSQLHQLNDRIVISFKVPVLIKYIEVEDTNSNTNISLEYISVDDTSFKRMPSSKINRSNFSTDSISLSIITQHIYFSAIMLQSIPNNDHRNISEIFLKIISIGGCTVAFMETNNNETTQLEWSIKVIANEIKTYPYLQVVPKGSEIDFKKIFRDNVDDSVTLPISLLIAVPSDKRDCQFEVSFVHNYLINFPDTAQMKFDNLKLAKHQDDKSTLNVSIDVTAINKDELEPGILHLNSALQTAISIYPCNTQTTQHSQQTGNPSTTNEAIFNTTSVVIIICLSSVILTLLLLIGYWLFQRQSFKTTKTDGTSESCTENRGYGMFDISGKHSSTCNIVDNEEATCSNVGVNKSDVDQ